MAWGFIFNNHILGRVRAVSPILHASPTARLLAVALNLRSTLPWHETRDQLPTLRLWLRIER
jgi:hypothetical protein